MSIDLRSYYYSERSSANSLSSLGLLYPNAKDVYTLIRGTVRTAENFASGAQTSPVRR